LAEKNRMDICERVRALELETIATSSNPGIAKLELAVRETELNATRTRIVMAMFGTMLSKK
jgi:multidrug resistance efflux pump